MHLGVQREYLLFNLMKKGIITYLLHIKNLPLLGCLRCGGWFGQQQLTLNRVYKPLKTKGTRRSTFQIHNHIKLKKSLIRNLQKSTIQKQKSRIPEIVSFQLSFCDSVFLFQSPFNVPYFNVIQYPPIVW